MMTMTFKRTIVFCIFFLCNHVVFPDTIITLKSGEVIVVKGNVSCSDITNTDEDIGCEDNAVVLENNGSWRLWIKEYYTPHHSFFRTKRGKIKVINQEKTVFYKKWFLGKKIIIGNLED